MSFNRVLLLKELENIIRDESMLSSWPSVAGFFASMSLVVAVVFAMVHLHGVWYWLAYPLAALIIGVAQHRLSVLHHEAIHRSFSQWPRLNESVGLVFIGASIGARPFQSRWAHLEHHRFLGTKEDPEGWDYLHAPRKFSQ